MVWWFVVKQIILPENPTWLRIFILFRHLLLRVDILFRHCFRFSSYCHIILSGEKLVSIVLALDRESSLGVKEAEVKKWSWTNPSRYITRPGGATDIRRSNLKLVVLWQGLTEHLSSIREPIVDIGSWHIYIYIYKVWDSPRTSRPYPYTRDRMSVSQGP